VCGCDGVVVDEAGAMTCDDNESTWRVCCACGGMREEKMAAAPNQHCDYKSMCTVTSLIDFHTPVADIPVTGASGMKPFEYDNSSQPGDGKGIVHFSAPLGLSLPYSLVVPKECDGFVLRFLRFIDGLFPEQRDLLSRTGSLCNRILTLRGWACWLICTMSILALLGIGVHTLAWLVQDPSQANVKSTLYLSVVSLVWIIEQSFCVLIRPVFPLRTMLGYIRDWSPLSCHVPKIFCTFASLVFVINVVYGLYQVYSTLGIRDCIPLDPTFYSSIAPALANCTKVRGVNDAEMYNLLGVLGAFGQPFAASPAASSVVLTFLYVIASMVWVTTPLQFAVVMMMNVMELRSGNYIIQSQLLDTDKESESAETVLKRLHAHIVAADIGSCRCNEVFGIVITVCLFFDLSLVAVLLSALQDPLYQKNSVLLPVSAFWMTASSLHICAFLLPIAAYNANLRNIQVLLYRYSARLNGLTTPSDSFDAWAKPLSTGLLKRLNDKVIIELACDLVAPR
jgi:hypothetical protein